MRGNVGVVEGKKGFSFLPHLSPVSQQFVRGGGGGKEQISPSPFPPLSWLKAFKPIPTILEEKKVLRKSPTSRHFQIEKVFSSAPLPPPI